MADVLREAIVSIKSTFDSSGLNQANSSFDKFLGKAKELTTVFGGLFAVHGLARLTEEAIKFGDTISDTSLRLGISAETLQEWGFVAEEAGISTETFAKGVSFLNANIGLAQQGNKGAIKSFEQLGISVLDSAGKFKSLEEILLEIPDGLRRLKTDSQRVAAASKLFGKAGKQTALVLAQNSDAIREQISNLRNMGGVLSGEAANSLSELDTKVNLVNKSWQVFKAEVVIGFKEAILTFTSAIGKGVAIFKQLNEQFGILKPILIGIGVAAAVLFAPWIIAGLKIIAVFTALGIVLEEVFGLFTGKKTVIGAVLAELFGFENVKKVIDSVKSAFNNLIDLMQFKGIDVAKTFLVALLAPFKLIFSTLESVNSAVKGFFSLVSGYPKEALKHFSNIKNPFKETGIFLEEKGTRIAQGAPLFGATGLEPKNFELGSLGKLGVLAPKNPEQLGTSVFGTTYNNPISNSKAVNNQVSATFNITSNDPHQVARVVREELGNELARAMSATTQDLDGE